MNQERIDYIVEELEQYLPTSAQALLQELMEGLQSRNRDKSINQQTEDWLNWEITRNGAYNKYDNPKKYNQIVKPLYDLKNPEENYKKTTKKPEKNYWKTAWEPGENLNKNDRRSL